MFASLKQTFNELAQTPLGFAITKQMFVWKKEFFSKTGVIPNWAIPKDNLIQILETSLKKGRITPLNAAALMCAVSIKHKHSQYDPTAFLNNFVQLYNAKTKDDIYRIEKISEGDREWRHIERIFQRNDISPERKLEEAKIFSWATDLEDATHGTFLGRLFRHHEGIHVYEVEGITSLYNRRSREKKLLESDGSKTLSAFPKDEYLPLLRAQREAGKISETQCGIILCFILHSQEKRNDGKSYITHPMGVADLVRQHGGKYLENNEGLVWKAMVAALLHDGGEKSNIKLNEDLNGLLPDDVIEAIKCLHKQDDDTYFEYIERIANNPLAATGKICDLYHNSLDNDDPSIKQTYTYPIAAAYLEYSLGNPSEKLTVMDFVAQKGVCTIKQFRDIVEATDIYRKDPLEKHQDRLGIISNVKPLKDYFKEEKLPDYAHSRRKENTPLYP